MSRLEHRDDGSVNPVKLNPANKNRGAVHECYLFSACICESIAPRRYKEETMLKLCLIGLLATVAALPSTTRVNLEGMVDF